jgi:DNA-binding NtrC family response regulator
MGHECEVAESAAAGLALATSQDFDLILCDYRLATETAADVVEGLARVAPHLIERMVIATGATTDAGVVELTESHGIKLVGKPYGVEELAAIIAEARARAAARA